MKVAYFTKTGVKKPEISLPKGIFGEAINQDQLKLAYNCFYANIRTKNAKTLTRAEVSGGGRKPWRQKGTGRARAGSSRNPLWRHGGVAFGPTGKENYTIKFPKKIIHSSLRQALSAQASNIKVVESFTINRYSTQQIVSLIDKINVEGSILIIAVKFNPKFYISARNIVGVKLLQVKQLNVAAILNADVILIDVETVKELERWLNPSKKISGVRS